MNVICIYNIIIINKPFNCFSTSYFKESCSEERAASLVMYISVDTDVLSDW